ncbi:hypothetical protein M422DRAFT_163947 [Sphaerobolus stellatus SS14]|nr:hypothetical protein M422DRAFT_163947 [Sphaerobolus stellatus SS14]
MEDTLPCKLTIPPSPPHLIFQISEICRHIFVFLSTPDLYRFGASCKSIQNTLQDFIPCTFNVNHRLKMFFNDPESFRRMQAETGTLVSGSFVLQTLTREYWLPSDLDLYIWPKEFETVRNWMKSAGYVETNRDTKFENNGTWADTDDTSVEENINSNDNNDDEDDNDNDNGSNSDNHSNASLSSAYPMAHIVTILFFEKKGKGNDILRVQVMVPETTPIQSILRFHSSMFVISLITSPVLILYPNI